MKDVTPSIYKTIIIYLDYLVDFSKPVFSKAEARLWQASHIHNQFSTYINKDLSFLKLPNKISFHLLE